MSSFFKLLLSSLLLSAATLLAQAPADTSTNGAPTAGATPAPKASKKKEGYLRFWNMLPKTEGELVLIMADQTPEGVALLSGSPHNYQASYIGMTPGHYAFKVVRRSDPATVLQNFNVILRGDVYVTFLASIFENRVKVEMLDDTYDPAVALTGKLTVRHFFPGASVVITVGNRISSRPLGFGETQSLEGLPLESVELKMKATDPKGQTQLWSTFFDFAAARHATLLVLGDRYGRFRPRAAVDGRGGREELIEPAN